MDPRAPVADHDQERCRPPTGRQFNGPMQLVLASPSRRSRSGDLDQGGVRLAARRLHHLADEEPDRLRPCRRGSPPRAAGLATKTSSINAPSAPASEIWRKPRRGDDRRDRLAGRDVRRRTPPWHWRARCDPSDTRRTSAGELRRGPRPTAGLAGAGFLIRRYSPVTQFATGFGRDAGSAARAASNSRVASRVGDEHRGVVRGQARGIPVARTPGRRQLRQTRRAMPPARPRSRRSGGRSGSGK